MLKNFLIKSIQIHYAATTSIFTSSKPNRQLHFLTLLCCGFLTSCGFQTYSAKPIQVETITKVFEEKSISDPSFVQFLAIQEAPPNIPMESWDLQSLVYCAHYFHPDLNLAREQSKLAQTEASLVKQKPIPTINGNFARSDRANNDINPFSYLFSIDIPINTHQKQNIRIEEFDHLSAIAKLNIAKTAWQLRHQVALSFIELHNHTLQLEALNKEVTLNKKIVDLLKKRVEYGEASNLELSIATRDYRTSQAALNTATKNRSILLARMAQQLGLPMHEIQTLQFNFDSLISPSSLISTPNLNDQTIRKTALLNRLDVRIALEEYAIAENKLKMEIAKQYPDMVISPGYSYDFGDNIWSLGFSGLMTLIEKNKAGITFAKQFREVEVSKFERLQTNIIAEVSQANLRYLTTLQQLSSQQSLLNDEKQRFSQIARQFDAGQIDRLTLTLADIALLAVEKQLIVTANEANMAKLNLENSLQKPLAQ
jgi:outer membrane protein, heavy metal efflux system